MKLSVFTVIVPKTSLQEAADKLAAAGYDGVEWRVREDFHIDPATIREKAAEVAKVSAAAGLEICALAPYIRASERTTLREIALACADMGCPAFRAGVPGYDRSRNYNELYDEAMYDLAALDKICAESGVRAQIEIHMGNIACSPSLAQRLVAGFDPARIGVIFDPGNMVYEGFENWRLGMELLGPHMTHVHVKNSQWLRTEGKWAPTWAKMDEGIVDWAVVVDDLRAVGYDGYLSLEDFSEWDSVDDKLAADCEYMRKIIG